MKAAIVAVGDELLAPSREETNSVFLTEKLAEAGIPVAFRAVVGDDVEAIGDVLRSALGRAGLVFLTGGLGPTSDDVTRDAVARALSLDMELDEDIVRAIRARFEARGVPMPDVNVRQALVPEGGDVLPNRCGTAPGLFIPLDDDRAVVLLPGPPAELRPMFSEHVQPRLASKAEKLHYDVRKLWIVGLAESSVEQKIRSAYIGVDNPSTTILASAGQVEVRLTATGGSPEEAAAKNGALSAKLEGLLGANVFSAAEEQLEEVVGRLLLSQGKRITVAESLTGGLIASRITDVSGSSRYFDESVVTYSNEAKMERLGVPEELFGRVGAVSEEVAHAMATGARAGAGADVAVAVTGIAGPTGGSTEKPVGLVYIALATDDGVRVEKFQFPGGRSQVKRWTSQAALNLVRLHLLHERGG